MKFGAASAERFNEFGVDGFLRPGGAPSPVVREVLPDDFIEIQFRAVRPQLEPECFVLKNFVLKNPVVQRIVMDARFVENDHGGSAISLPDQRIQKSNNGRAFHGPLAARMKLFSRSSAP
ncbi:hypothetical protein SB861_21270 [Paraburkholderia sp. SIMBA_049]